MTYYKSKRPVDGKPPIWVIVNENGKIINKNSSKDELKGLKRFPEKDGRSKPNYHNETNTCDRCRESLLLDNNPRRERDKEGKETGKWLCHKCKSKDYNDMPDSHKNVIKSLRNCRIGNQDPNHESTKADRSQELACKLYNWKDLNKENDNHSSSLDCYDPKTGLYHQVQMRYYNFIEGYWPFNGFVREWGKMFVDMICFCISKDGDIVERIYKFPENIVKDKSGAAIVKSPSKGGGGWYEEYRIADEDELKNANEIWKEII